MKVRFTPEAEKQADESDTWWREHRDVRDLFARELAAIMPKTRTCLYYTADIEAGVILVHAVWGAPRGEGPKL